MGSVRIKRHEDWPTRLARFLEESRGREFRYGDWDCCLAVCDAIEAMTGFDPGATFRGQYSTELGAIHVMLEYSGGNVIETVELETAVLEVEEVPIARAGRGDVVLVELEAGPSLGVVDLTGKRVAVAAHPRGLAFLPIARGLRAWKVGV